MRTVPACTWTVIGANRSELVPSIVTRWPAAVPGAVLAGPDAAGVPLQPVTAALRAAAATIAQLSHGLVMMAFLPRDVVTPYVRKHYPAWFMINKTGGGSFRQ
jgi:hypothetical protein